MSDRTLALYEEPRDKEDHTRYWLSVERSAAGQPALVFTITYIDDYANEGGELTVVVEDGNKFLSPVIDWLDEGWGR